MKQVLLYVNKMLKPLGLSIKEYRGKAYNTEHLNDFDELIKSKNERGTYYIGRSKSVEAEEESYQLLHG